MLCCRRFCGPVLVLTLLASTPAWADVIVNSSLDLTKLLITPSSGSLVILSPVTASVFAQALDSTGGFDQSSNSINDNAPVSVSAATPFANASATASALALTQHVLANVNLPNQFNGFASSEQQALPFGLFEITGATGPVMTNIDASLAGNQFLMTSTRVSASSETIFTLTSPHINLSPLLFFDSPLSIGPNQTLASLTSPTLIASMSQLPNTPYSFFAALDAEENGVSTPERASFLLLTALGLSALLFRRAWRVRLHRDTEPRP